jgi:hypothetical protein
MHHSTKRRVVLGMTTGGLLLTGIGMAQADAAADGGASHSPGVASGNLIQIPIDAPINLCGNDISVVGILDSAFGNQCANADGGNGATAAGGAKDSPGVGSGNLIQVPIDTPINLCGNDVSGVGIGDKAVDNTCVNGGGQGGQGGQGANTSSANGGSHGSPGIGSGNTVQLPINAPINVCGDQVSGIGIGDTAADNTCVNGGPGVSTVIPPNHPTPPCGCGQPSTPPTTWTPPPPPATGTSGAPTGPSTPTGGSSNGSHPGGYGSHGGPSGTGGSSKLTGSLAETGTGAGGIVAPLGAGMLGGGSLLLRKRMASLHHLTRRQH